MLKFKTLHELKPNAELLEIIKHFKSKTKKGKIKVLENTNTNHIFLFFFRNYIFF